MKIGILTFHRAYNYGAVLQCYSLQEALKAMGHDVWVIDYRQPYIEKSYKPFRLMMWLGYVIHVRKDAFRYLRSYPNRKRKEHNFEKFISERLHCTSSCTKDNIPQDFDVYIIGSDQVWNWDCLGTKVDGVYLGQFNYFADSKLVGYAISAKLGSFDKIGVERLRETLDRFSFISFREEIISKVVACITNSSQFPVCCDPVFLNGSSFWDKLTDDKFKYRNYVLTYGVRNIKDDPTYLYKKGISFADRLGCELIDASSGKFSVTDFVSLFKYARYVITTSFHGTAFSLIFRRPFYSIKLHDGSDERYSSLLHIIGADEYCVDMNFEPDINRGELPSKISDNLTTYSQKSRKFLSQIK